MKRPELRKAIEIYYSCPEIGNPEIKELSGVASSTAVRIKKAVLEEMAKRHIRTWLPRHINTKLAYEMWGIDIADYEKRLKKLEQLKGGHPNDKA